VIALRAAQEGHRYPVRIGPVAGGLREQLAGRTVALVSCDRVAATPFGRRVAAEVRRGAAQVLVQRLPDGERGKTLAVLERASVQLLRGGLQRDGCVVALGGGALTDAAGFLAATYMRGIPWIAIPTTLLGMVDAALGGKTAVNLPIAKNAVGAFHPPAAVLADLAALNTLPAREMRSGFGEVLKYGALDPGLLRRAAARAAAGRPDAALVAACVRMKLSCVARDPRERGERKLLNLGHTFGHAVEAAGGFRAFSHGEAVAVGLDFAFRLAARLGRIGPGPVEQMALALRGAGLPTRVSAAIARRAGSHLGYDKKRGSAGLGWVLPVASGRGWRVEWDVGVPEGAVSATLRESVGQGLRRG
jgi:3-dehydroquinate synthetase